MFSAEDMDFDTSITQIAARRRELSEIVAQWHYSHSASGESDYQKYQNTVNH